MTVGCTRDLDQKLIFAGRRHRNCGELVWLIDWKMLARRIQSLHKGSCISPAEWLSFVMVLRAFFVELGVTVVGKVLDCWQKHEGTVMQSVSKLDASRAWITSCLWQKCTALRNMIDTHDAIVKPQAL